MKIIDNHIITNKQYFHLKDVACIELRKYGKVDPIYDLRIRLADNQTIYEEIYNEELDLAKKFKHMARLISKLDDVNFVLANSTLINMDLVREIDFVYGMQGVNIEFPSFHHKLTNLGKDDAEKLVDELQKQYLENISRKM